MKVFVVTPYFNTPEDWLRQCHDSVRTQSMPATHIVVCDGALPTPIPGFQGVHVVLRRNYSDYGATPRLVGSFQAVTEGADAIAYLDADNWYYPGHLQAMAEFMRAHDLGAASSSRMLHRMDGSTMARCKDVDGDTLVDTNCLMVMRPAFPHLVGWTLAGQDMAAAADNMVWRHMRAQGVRTGFMPRATVAYRTRHADHYWSANEPAPDDAVMRPDLDGTAYR